MLSSLPGEIMSCRKTIPPPLLQTAQEVVLLRRGGGRFGGLLSDLLSHLQQAVDILILQAVLVQTVLLETQ